VARAVVRRGAATATATHTRALPGGVPGRPPAVSVTTHNVGVTAPVELERPESAPATVVDKPWITVVWNDPVNLMSYVAYVFQQYFGYAKPRAQKLMMDVHTVGRAVVSAGGREEMERDVEAMHGYGLWATVAKSGDT